ncbi:thrombospondin type-1 domain-containing protein 4-like isoform X2 [Anneissia japonica]|uniref:thrombospondin type-1 domain-containing protein 4-like isoform X2 n=1 Tax=Anneissia japonica TaxID=1529436 RepID=UPI001425A27A|nr:thrombospondin type-1 domain-containing protein 4-like isoform X2 [Anneissia japonica]
MSNKASHLKKVGCDGVLSSGLVYDKCGICGGDNTRCEVYKGTFSTVLMNVGYNTILTIPTGAMYINVTEVQQSRNYLALAGTNGEAYINGEWRIVRAGNYSVAGTVFQYKRTSEGRLGSGQQLLAVGPTNIDLEVQLIFQKANPGIEYEYVLQGQSNLQMSTTPKPKITTESGDTMVRADQGVGQGKNPTKQTPPRHKPKKRPKDKHSAGTQNGNQHSGSKKKKGHKEAHASAQATAVPHPPEPRPTEAPVVSSKKAQQHEDVGLTSPDLPPNLRPNSQPVVDSGGLWPHRNPNQQQLPSKQPDSDLGSAPSENVNVTPDTGTTTEAPDTNQNTPEYPRRHHHAPNIKAEEDYAGSPSNPNTNVETSTEQPAPSERPTGSPHEEVDSNVQSANKDSALVNNVQTTPEPLIQFGNTSPSGDASSSGGKSPSSDTSEQKIAPDALKGNHFNGNSNDREESGHTTATPYTAGFYGPKAGDAQPGSSQDGSYPSGNPYYPNPNGGAMTPGTLPDGRPKVINPYKPGFKIPDTQPHTRQDDALRGGYPRESGYDGRYPNNGGYPQRYPQNVGYSSNGRYPQYPGAGTQQGGGRYYPSPDVGSGSQTGNTGGLGAVPPYGGYTPNFGGGADSRYPQGSDSGGYNPANQGRFPGGNGGGVGGGVSGGGGLAPNTGSGRQSPVLNPYKPGNVGSAEVRYLWQEIGLSDCSATCAGGTQQRLIMCLNVQTGTEADESFCDSKYRPPMMTLICNTQPCPAMWEVGIWSQCSRTCGRGMQMRQVICKQKKSTSLTTIVDMGNCDASNIPEKIKECSLARCTMWKTGRWQACSALCGDGIQNRAVTCVDDNMNPVDESSCDIQNKPQDWIACAGPACDTQWFYGDWPEQCSRECGGGQKSRVTVCTTIGLHGDLGNTQCDISVKPREVKACNSLPCGAKWYASDWGQCSAECGSGVQTRNVLCISESIPKQVLDDAACPGSRPNQQQRCETKPCAPMWLQTDWSDCSKTCGGGLQTREVKCMSRNMDASIECDESKKPETQQQCNKMKCTLLTQPSSTCTDRYTYCMKVAQARLCSYAFYKKYCCHSCFGRR